MARRAAYPASGMLVRLVVCLILGRGGLEFSDGLPDLVPNVIPDRIPKIINHAIYVVHLARYLGSYLGGAGNRGRNCLTALPALVPDASRHAE
jgi:hypothetical protein